MKNNFIYVALVAAGFASCEPEFENPVSQDYSAGEANFATYVSVGNSLTAGYMDGTVSRVGQTYSYPNLLAQQFAKVGGGAFTQPSFADDTNDLGGLPLPGFSTRLVIDAAQGRPEPLAGAITISLAPQAKAYHNMGVPGAKSFHLVAPGYGNAAGLAMGLANPYFVRHATSATTTVLQDAMSKNPTFFTNWIGSNDVLSYATSGGTRPDNPATTTVDESMLPAADHNATGNTDPSTYGSNDITNSNTFAAVYTSLINALTSGGAKGVVCTIPSVTSIPYFTSVPFAPLTPTALGGSANITALNQQLYGPLSQVFTALGEPNRIKLLSATAANPILIVDVDAQDRSAQITAALTPTLGVAQATAFGMLFGRARQTTANDLIVLTASSVIGSTNAAAPAGVNINGVTFPMANKFVLTANEKLKVANATNSYNAAIRAAAASKNLAVADMNAVMNELVSGLRADNGTLYTANYFGGGSSEFKVLFSLDGVHPNARGYSVIANEIIKVINTHYKSKLPLLNPNNFPGINLVPTN